jgi:hypothetical protein
MQKFKEQPRLESITVSFHQGGCGVDGAHYRRRPSFQPCLAFPSPRPPDAAGQEVASKTSFIHATKRERPLIKGPPRVPWPGPTNVDLCGREHAHAGYCPGNQLAFAQSVRRARHAEFSSRSCTMD